MNEILVSIAFTGLILAMISHAAMVIAARRSTDPSVEFVARRSTIVANLPTEFAASIAAIRACIAAGGRLRFFALAQVVSCATFIVSIIASAIRAF
jgi:hypothetical protein